MPLPINGTVSLLGSSRPGESTQPKQAMIVRMSAESLEALESSPGQMDFVFGDQPGIYIGSTFFSMRPVKEATAHEVYLRASTANKKNAPLKLYANVTGKFTVERELGDKIADKVRESTMDAANQRNNRTTIMLDTPPTLSTQNNKKRKDAPTISSTMFRKPPRPDQSSTRNTLSVSAPPPARVPSPAPREPSKEGQTSLRQRMVHFLAVNDRSQEELVKNLGGPSCSKDTQRAILQLMGELAEPVVTGKNSSDKSPKMYSLKTEMWREVRPYEWPRLTESDRLNMARRARSALKSLGVSETDPAWNHIRYRSRNANDDLSASTSTAHRAPTGASGLNGSAAKADVPKRGISSKEAKEKKAKPKVDHKSEIMMKDESKSAATTSSQVVNRHKDAPQATASRPVPTPPVVDKSAPPLRKPGSGFKVVQTLPQESKQETRPSNSGRSSLTNGKAVETRAKYEEDVAEPRRPSSLPSYEQKVASAIPLKMKKYKDEVNGASDSDNERRRDRERDRDRGMDKPRARDREREEGEHSEDSVASLKRKKHVREADEHSDAGRGTIPKKRKMESIRTSTQQSALKEGGGRNLSTSKKSELSSRSKPVKRESSPPSRNQRDHSPVSRPPPPALTKSSATAASSSSSNRPQTTGSNSSKVSKSSSAKARRRSPIYTSSSSEGELPPSRPHRRSTPSTSVPLPTLPTTVKTQYHPSNLSSHAARSLPTDHASLRARYSTSYMKYLSTFQQMVTQRTRIEGLLKNVDRGSTGSITDSDGDIELLDADELEKLSSEHRRLEEELETIQRLFSKSAKSEALLD
ncbi:hypothetical protein BDQ12DRAFT_673329 [Crucibulum laeve]|uniref:RNA polymerase II elongation factor ELL N-terminal domain-containing protein n=1 Tax=Crucibulum laeve TaxID=68775 RepID=A0A5C3MHK1_9AGAR|nr:hypothetical protein BDQ12DRAFT_673329 [Crucibulum laeve]